MSRILILDDNPGNCRALRDFLQRTPALPGTVVETAVTVESAHQRVVKSLRERSPFDIFLIDQYLENSSDGIEAMVDLRRMSPSTDAIVITGQADPGSGQRAYAAGASRYLQQPLDFDELILILRSLNEWRQVRQERAWMQILIEITEAAEKVHDFHSVARVIVEGSLRLGFERARLFWVPERQRVSQQDMVGMWMAGKDRLDDFYGRCFRIVDSPYALAAQRTRQPRYFQQRSLGAGIMEKHFGVDRFRPPVGEWACIPLWSSDRFSGILTLDNADQAAAISDDQRKLLELYSRHVTAILERSRLFGRETHSRHEIELINQIGKQITIHVSDLDNLLEEIRRQIGERFKCDNFFVALIDEDTRRLDFRLHYEKGIRQERHWRGLHEGLAGYLVRIKAREPVYLPFGSDAYCRAHDIAPFGPPALCWVGIPLWAAARMIGVMVVQDYEQTGLYSTHDIALLSAVTDQIAGAIYVAQMVEREQDRLALLQQASAELVRLASENETWMWQALLNIISARYGLKFNRVWLFLAEAAKQRLSGVMGVGHVKTRDAFEDWERDLKPDIHFDGFIRQLRSGELRHTPLEEMTRELSFDEQEMGPALSRALNSGSRQRLSAADAAALLPGRFVEQFAPSECALVPLRAGDQCIGLVIVDNKHNREPITEESLDRLETFLNMAGLVYLNERRRAEQLALLKATDAVARQTERVSLGETLNKICEAALVVNQADWVTIYPLKDGGGLDEYDVKNIGQAGNLLVKNKDVKEKPRQRGMSAYILHGGRLVVNDVQKDEQMIDGRRLRDHPFIIREKIQAFFGLPVIDQLTAEPLGTLFINYRKRQCFSPEDVQRAVTFTNLAGIAIRNAYAAELGLANRRELNILQTVLKGALSNMEEGLLIRVLINAMCDLLQSERFACRVVLTHWETLQERSRPELVFRPFRAGTGTGLAGYDLSLEERRWITETIETGQVRLEENGTRILAPIKTGIRPLGVLDVQARGEMIAQDRQRALERLAAVAALALDNLHRQMNLLSALESARAFTAPSGLEDTLRAIVEQVQIVSPDISALTIWYRDIRSETFKLGPSFGVMYPEKLPPVFSPRESVVRYVINATEPIWAADVQQEPRLFGNFITREQVKSAAAFPLRANNEIMGAMFFNYRLPHAFTQEEQLLFSLLAEIVAASIQDAAQLEDRQRESERLEATLSITDAVGTSLDLAQVIDKTLSELANILEYVQAVPCLLTYNELERTLEFEPQSFKYYHVDNPQEAGTLTLRLTDRSIATRVAQKSLQVRKPVVENTRDVELDPEYRRMILGTRSQLCVSLYSTEKLLGVLVLESSVEDAFGQEEERLVYGIAQQVSMAIERVRQIELLNFKGTVATATAWASDIAHDINREVGRIREHVYWIKEKSVDPGPILKHLNKIDESATRLASMGPKGNQADNPFRVDEDITAWVRNFLINTGSQVEVQFDLHCKGVETRANTVGLERSLRHLVRNAVQAMNQEGRLIIHTEIVEGHLEIHVEDSGPGLDEAVRLQIFQAPVSTKKEQGGFGLLLTRQMIEDMGGVIWAASPVPGRGARFCIRLPLN